MLKKMRWRFIGAAMTAFASVILALLCAVNLWNYHDITAQQDSSLLHLSQVSGEGKTFPPEPNAPPIEGGGRFSKEVQYMLRFFSVHYDSSGNVTRVDKDHVVSISEEEAQSYATRVLNGKKTGGYYNSYRFLVKETDSETTVLFLNSEKELQSVRSLLILTLVIALSCLLIVFLLVIFFSKRAIAPYVRNLETQKQFITNAGHELKTPLTAISTSADVLEMEYADDEWVQNIKFQSGRLSKLISNLVTLSRLDEENPFPEKSEFSLSDAVWEISEPFETLAAAKGLRYDRSIENDLTVTGDCAAVQQMISILLDNALKYTAENGRIFLNAYGNGKKSVIEIGNTCSTEEIPDLSRLFERFYRPDSSRSKSTGGTGIGLSIAKATAEAHGGTIKAERTSDGIMFKIVL